MHNGIMTSGYARVSADAQRRRVTRAVPKRYRRRTGAGLRSDDRRLEAAARDAAPALIPLRLGTRSGPAASARPGRLADGPAHRASERNRLRLAAGWRS